MTLECARVTRIRGTIYDIPPRPSILAMLEGAAAYAQQCQARAELDRHRVAESEARRAGTKAADHERRIVRLIRRTADWISTAAICAEVDRTTGVRLNPGSVGHMLTARGDFERKVQRERVFWRQKQ